MIPSGPARLLQTTLARAIRVSGVGMHSGAEVSVEIGPAPAGSGIHFISGSTRIPARASFVVNTRRCTGLGVDGARIDTVEHLLSALAGMNVDNADILVEGPELPILDGSSLPWVDAIKEAGVCELTAPVRRLFPREPVFYESDGTWLIATPADEFCVTCVSRFNHPMLGTTVVCYGGGSFSYVEGIAPARTFGLAEEVDALREAGLARGGSLDNALIIYRDHFSDRLRMRDEWACHKLLDLIGDLALAGGRLQAAITAICPSHQANVAFATRLADISIQKPV